MAIELKLEKKVLSCGKIGYVVREFKLLSKKELPEMYLNTYPNCYLCSYHGRITINISKDKRICLKYEFYGEEEIEKFLVYLRKCGDNLRKANEKLAQMREEWKGEVEIII